MSQPLSAEQLGHANASHDEKAQGDIYCWTDVEKKVETYHVEYINMNFENSVTGSFLCNKQCC